MDVAIRDAARSERIFLGEGWVSHHRPLQRGRGLRTLANAFNYPIFNLLIPVHNEQELRSLDGHRWMSLKAENYLEGKKASLFVGVTEFLSRHFAYDAEKIWLQTMPQMFGYVFNPVSFWFCLKGGKLDAVLCEVNNTFGDRHFYFVKDVVPGQRFFVAKAFHVSPFLSLQGQYAFEFDWSERASDVKIKLFDSSDLKLETRIALKMRPFAKVSKLRLLRRYGWLTLLVMIRIHYQAVRLWFKGAEFFRRPSPSIEKVKR